MLCQVFAHLRSLGSRDESAAAAAERTARSSAATQSTHTGETTAAGRGEGTKIQIYTLTHAVFLLTRSFKCVTSPFFFFFFFLFCVIKYFFSSFIYFYCTEPVFLLAAHILALALFSLKLWSESFPRERDRIISCMTQIFQIFYCKVKLTFTTPGLWGLREERQSL